MHIKPNQLMQQLAHQQVNIPSTMDMMLAQHHAAVPSYVPLELGIENDIAQLEKAKAVLKANLR
ncbi:MAG: hypothetical protein ACK4HE_01645 [Chitinophagaceae bacterium]